MSALMLVRMPEHRLICPISKNSSPDAHGVGWDGGEDAGRHAAGGAADRFGTRPQRDDREGEVSGVGDNLVTVN